MQIKGTNNSGETPQKKWLNFIDRKTMNSGELINFINEYGITGSAFDLAAYRSAILTGREYTDDICSYADKALSSDGVYKAISIDDAKTAADIFENIYKKSGGIDGFVTLGIAPSLSYDAKNMLIQLKEMWEAIDRQNVMIQIPATKQSLTVIRECIKSGININIASIYGLTRYKEVAEAYLSGLEDRVAMKKPIDKIFSVTSFLTGRIDELTDSLLEGRNLFHLKGKVGIATALKAYKIFNGIFFSDQFKKLESLGANKLQIVWVNSELKDPVRTNTYLHSLQQAQTIATVSKSTMKAANGYEQPAEAFDQAFASRVLAELDDRGIDINIITQKLEDLDIRKLNNDYNELMENIRSINFAKHAKLTT